MKKFLTVLLVIAVMFTFSFGSAFAATAVPGATATTHDEKVAEAVAKINAEIDAKAAAVKKALAEEYELFEISNSKYIRAIVAGDVYAATVDQMVADYKAALAVAAQKVAADETIVDVYTAIKGTKVEKAVLYAGTNELSLYVNNFTDWKVDQLVGFVTSASASHNLEGYYMVQTYANALAGLKADVKAELAKVNMGAYTNDVMDPVNDPYKTTYAQAAAKAMADLEKVIADTEVKMTMTAAEAQKAVKDMYDAVRGAITVVDTIEYIDGTVIATEYKFYDSALKTADQLEADKAGTEANKATLKAEIAKVYADFYAQALNTYNASAKKDADKKAFADEVARLDAMKEVNYLLIDEEEVTSNTQFVEYYTAKTRVDAYEAAEKVAALCKIQVEKEGSAKYVASEIDEILADLQVEIYAGRTTTVTAADFADALVSEDLLEWNRAHAICDVEDAMEAELYNACGDAVYYAPEQAKVEAKYAEKIAKIEAAATQKQLEAAAALKVTHTIKTKAEVRNVVAGHLNTKKFADAVAMYVQFMNKSAGIAAYSDAYRNETVAYDANSAVVKYLAGEGARTNADVAGYLAQAEAFAQTIKTNGELKAAKAAANDAIKALPNYITLADKEAVKAADDLAYAAGVTSTKLTQAIDAVKKAELKAIADMIKALPAKLAAADDAAVSAIYTAIYAFEDECLYGHEAVAKTTYDAVKKAADAVKAAWLADVHAAIAAVDAEDEATVVAAREAVDAFVARYTSVCSGARAITLIQNIDKLTYAEAQVALAKIEAVEALKITAGSTAKKGAITVKWTVKGDTSAVEGYEIWKSTKKNSGFKKAFTTTKMSYKNTKGLKKGTKYFYKVRAIAYVGAEKITSDWSNKAYRVAK